MGYLIRNHRTDVEIQLLPFTKIDIIKRNFVKQITNDINKTQRNIIMRIYAFNEIQTSEKIKCSEYYL